ncbi:MAG: heme-binding domain-containing protein [Bdellovibrionales bacterium]
MKQLTKVKCIFISLAAFAFFSLANAHQDHAHHKPKLALSSSEEEKRQSSLYQINEKYKQIVKPIFQKNCFNCHSEQTQYPWYYKLPIAKQLIDSDILESKKHIDLTNDFPFRGHGSPEEDLPAVRKVIEDNTMPPFRYKILHSESGLSEDERQAILRWIQESLNALQPSSIEVPK